MDLDEIELKATRKLLGLDKKENKQQNYDDNDYLIAREECIEYKKVTDTNVGDIEEAIEILKNAIRCNEKQFEELGTHILLQDDEQEAIKIVLANLEILCDMQISADRELKNARKINEEHQKINAELREKVKKFEEEKKNRVNFQQKYIEVTNLYLNSIPKQKIVDKMQERKFELQQEYKDFEDDEILQVLQELLQEENK